jgi:hypothetical protein
MNLFCYSPGYLKALKSCARGYSFKIHGYSKIDDCIKGLPKVNALSYLGFCYLGGGVPEDVNKFIKWVGMCSTLSSYKKKRLVVAVRDSSGMEELLRKCNTSNLEVYLLTFEILTDIIIRSEIFGTVLEGVYTPYEEEKDPLIVEVPAPLPLLKLEFPFPLEVLRCLSPVNALISLNATIAQDKTLDLLEASNSKYGKLRRYLIYKEFNREEEVKYLLEDVFGGELDIKDKLIKNYLEGN